MDVLYCCVFVGTCLLSRCLAMGMTRIHIENTSCNICSIVWCVYWGRCLEMAICVTIYSQISLHTADLSVLTIWRLPSSSVFHSHHDKKGFISPFLQLLLFFFCSIPCPCPNILRPFYGKQIKQPKSLSKLVSRTLKSETEVPRNLLTRSIFWMEYETKTSEPITLSWNVDLNR
jgi:hypothetical protein